MIPTNITKNIPSKTASQYYQERDNAFYLTQIATNYDEGDIFTIETPIVCRALAFAITAGTKIIVNGIELEIYADAAASATQFFITATTLESPIDFASIVSIDQKNLFLQYQDKTEGTVAGFDIDADGMSKGGVEITGWLDSDTMEGATENNIPTAQSVKAYVDDQVGASDTLQEVTDNGNTTTNSIIMPTGGTGIRGPNNFELWSLYSNRGRITLNSTNSSDASIQITFKTNGSSSMVITKAGNVGIGTTSPSEKLSISGGNIAVPNGSAIMIGGAIADTKIGKLYNVDGVLSLDGDGTRSIRLGSTTNGEVIRVDNANGNVGIGTTSPSYKLHIVGETLSDDGFRIKISDDTFQRVLSPTGTKSVQIGDAAIDDLKFKNANGNSLVIKSSGNVGIGTNSPLGLFQLDEYTVASQGGNTAHGVASIFADSGDEALYIGVKDAAYPNRGYGFKVTTSGVNSDFTIYEKGLNGDRLTIKTGGNVGIGTTSPSYKLDLQDTSATYVARFRGSNSTYVQSGESTLSGETGFLAKNSTGALYLGVTGGVAYFTGTSGANTMKFGVGGAEKMRITSDGNVLIGTTTDDGYKLDVNGTQRVQDVLELDDVLTLNAISTPDDPTDGKSSIYMDSATGDIKVKINVGGEVVTRTLASYDG